jgi:hypothetical protein
LPHPIGKADARVGTWLRDLFDPEMHHSGERRPGLDVHFSTSLRTVSSSFGFLGKRISLGTFGSFCSMTTYLSVIKLGRESGVRN